MQRISRIDEAAASDKTRDLLSAVRKQMGGVPNIIATLAQSSAALGGYLGFAGALSQGRLSGGAREQIALAVAGANECDYCASAHTVLGGMHGIDKAEIDRNLKGISEDPKTQAALRFATRIVASRGHLSDTDLADIRAAGYSEEEVVEIIGHTLLNIFTNYLNHIADTEIDFPVVRTGNAAAA
ncbi:MAG: carboxymuconolactone decarboxylase family protein [Rhodospirillales bacterium]